jgi:hypothetical protein
MNFEEFLKLLTPEHELNIQKRQEIKYKLDNILKPYEGHPVFEVDFINKTVKKASVKPIDTVSFLNWKEEIKEQNIIKNPNCMYVSALNIKNIKKKLVDIDSKFEDYMYIKEDNKQYVNKHRKVKLYK